MNRQFWYDTVFGTLFIFFLIFLFANLTFFKIFDVFDPIGEALSDLELTDYAFSHIREDPVADTNIVVVNLPFSRRDIAVVLSIINQYEPAVVGIDAFFPEPKEEDPIGDVMLQNALKEMKNLVMVSRLENFNEDTGEYDTVFNSHPMFLENAHTGFANLATDAEFQDDLKSVREFPTHRSIHGIDHVAFGIKVAELFNSETSKRYLERDNEYEKINFRGNVLDPFNKAEFKNQFFALDVEDVLNENFTPDIIKDKIVIFGFMGEFFGDPSWDDKFFTPLNPKVGGRANPDMFGVVVHANIASMIIYDIPIGSMGNIQTLIFSILVCYINVMVFSWIYRRLPRWYDGLTKLIQLTEVMIFMLVAVYVFAAFSYKLELTLPLVCVLLASDSLEIYNGVVKNLFSKDRHELFKLQYGRD